MGVYFKLFTHTHTQTDTHTDIRQKSLREWFNPNQTFHYRPPIPCFPSTYTPPPLWEQMLECILLSHTVLTRGTFWRPLHTQTHTHTHTHLLSEALVVIQHVAMRCKLPLHTTENAYMCTEYTHMLEATRMNTHTQRHRYRQHCCLSFDTFF